MIQNSILIILLFFFLPGVCQTISGVEVSYKVEVNSEQTLKQIKKPQVSVLFQNARKSVGSLEFTLIADRDESLFKYNNMMGSDFNKGHQGAITMVGGNNIYYSSEELSLVNKSIFGETFNVVVNNKYNWEITRERKDILGFSCIKAISNYETIDKNGDKMKVTVYAWFTPDINISGGPFGFNNLPGLVLQAIKDKKFIFYATKINFIENQEEIDISLPKANVTIDESEFEALLKDKLLEIRGRG